ncbi:MAG: nucleoside triphosphate pyrophosphohydrolase family protein [Clostridia bacterium]|nr:nucleoside triphosphate pyrophosphohydrolase family protein [Clostridia bacterium]
MNLNEYQAKALRTSGEGHDRIENGLMGLMGECGEIVDLLKKHIFQSSIDADLPVDKLEKETGDVLWYCAEFATGMGMKLSEVASYEENYSSCMALRERFMARVSRLCLKRTAISMLSYAVEAYQHFYDRDDLYLTLWSVSRLMALINHLCKTLDMPITHVMEQNIEKLLARYPDGFDPERSMHRPEYQQTT